MALAMAFGSPVAAFAVLQQSGQTGDYGTRSSTKGPEAKCGYTSPFSAHPLQLHWMKVYPVLVGPATGLSQKVSWTVVIQKSTNGGTTWKNTGSPKTQTGTATGSSNPHYTTVTINLTGTMGVQYRAVSTLKWLHNGSTTGLVKFRMTTYGIQEGSAQSTAVLDDYCDGVILN